MEDDNEDVIMPGEQRHYNHRIKFIFLKKKTNNNLIIISVK